jgi:hypothetical protein
MRAAAIGDTKGMGMGASRAGIGRGSSGLECYRAGRADIDGNISGGVIGVGVIPGTVGRAAGVNMRAIGIRGADQKPGAA